MALGHLYKAAWGARATCVWLLVLALMAGRAAAQEPAVSAEPAGYRQAIDDAMEEFGAQNYQEARALFHQAHELYPNARTFRALGLVEYELRNYVECIGYLEAALSSSAKPLTAELKADTERMLTRANNLVARVQIDAKPAASRVLVDGTQVEPKAGELLLQVGDYTLSLEAPGFAPETRKLSVQGGEQQTLTVIFAHRLADTTPTKSEKRWYKSPWLWGTVGVVVVGAAAAGAGVALARDDKSADAYGGNANTVLKGP